jgi:hypothetical protein
VIARCAPYDAATGRINLVGLENQDGCGETSCLNIDIFSDAGDLRPTEAPPGVPGVPGIAWLIFGASLALTRRCWPLRAP